MTRTTRRLQWTLTLALSGTLLCGAANAQSPGSESAPPMSGSSEGGAPAAGGGASLGTVSNETTETTTSVTTSTGADFESAEGAPLPNTGGEPLLVTMLGSLLAGSALMLRRKVS